jgi:hypothetical protein
VDLRKECSVDITYLVRAVIDHVGEEEGFCGRDITWPTDALVDPPTHRSGYCSFISATRRLDDPTCRGANRVKSAPRSIVLATSRWWVRNAFRRIRGKR